MATSQVQFWNMLGVHCMQRGPIAGHAARALWNTICRNAPNQDAAREAGAVPLLLGLLRSPLPTHVRPMHEQGASWTVSHHKGCMVPLHAALYASLAWGPDVCSHQLYCPVKSYVQL